MRTKHARQIRKGIEVAKADIASALSPDTEGIGLTARVQLTGGILRTRIMRYAHSEYTRRRVVKLGEGQAR